MLHPNFFKVFSLIVLVLNLYAEKIYTVDDLIIQSLENSPNLQISKANYEASKSRYDIAFSSYLPSLDLHASTGKYGQNNTTTTNHEMINDTLLLGKLSAKQIIYDFGQTSGNVQSSKFEANALNLQNIQEISDKKRDVKEAYYNVLKSLSLINVQKENVKLNDAQLYRSKKYFTAGIRTKIDVSDAKVGLIQAKLDLKRAEYDLELAYANLDQVIGYTQIQHTYKVYSQKLHLDTLYDSLIDYPYSLPESIKFAYKNRAVLQQQKESLKASKAKKEQTTSAYYPALYLLTDYTKQSVDKFKNFIPQDQWQATVNLDWNIYQGGATNASQQEKEININIANATLMNSKLNIKKETTQAYINVNKKKDSIALSQSLVDVSSEKFNQASKRYKYGLSDYIELQQARQEYIDAKANLIITYYNYYTAIANLDNAIGK